MPGHPSRAGGGRTSDLQRLTSVSAAAARILSLSTCSTATSNKHQRTQPARPVAAARPQPAPLTYGIAWAVAVCACPGESVLRGPGCVPRWCARDGPDRRPTCPSRVSPRCERGPGFQPRPPARSAGRGAQAAPVSGSLPRAATGPPMPRHAPPAPSGPHPARWGPIENAGVRDHPSRWRARVRGGWLLGLRPFVHCWAERSHARALHSTRECTA